jgi:hypothetical protein
VAGWLWCAASRQDLRPRTDPHVEDHWAKQLLDTRGSPPSPLPARRPIRPVLHIAAYRHFTDREELLAPVHRLAMLYIGPS